VGRSTRPTLTPISMIGQALSHYTILEQIGAAGMGVVYLAHDEQLDRDVAIKVLPPAHSLASVSAKKRWPSLG
jgi:serine/threonine protein kinase